jgi:endonuclease/exonuclease/phosphatase family metal-dependent hydrolase
MILMSNNQWKCDKNHEAWIAIGDDCSSEGRVDGLVRSYLEVMPDVLGLQEVSLHMADLMMEKMRKVELPDGTVAKYEYVSGGDTPIVYRRDKLKLLESGFFRYTEAIPGYEGSFNNSETKSYAYGVFEDRVSGKRFALMSTHLWWKSSNPNSDPKYYLHGSDEARAYQIMQAASKMDEMMDKYHCPGIIMGDFNAKMDSPCLKAVQWAGWREVHDLAVGDCDQTRGHHPCGPGGYKRVEMGTFDQAIDHIVVKNPGELVVNHFRRITDEYFDRVSDHYPLYIDVTL